MSWNQRRIFYPAKDFMSQEKLYAVRTSIDRR